MDKARIRKDILTILVLYFLSQVFLLFLTGTFWDDWSYVTKENDVLFSQYISAGTPSRIYLIMLMWLLPAYAYRWVTFLLFAVISVLFYFILCNISVFNRTDALYITLISTVIPVNAARVSLSTEIYTLGLAFFMIAFFLLTMYLKETDNIKKRIVLRVSCLILFVCSFVLNSNTVFFSTALLYIGVHGFLQCKGTKPEAFKSALKSYLHHIDFIIAPIIFYIIKNALFPIYGLYANYNTIKLKYLLKAIPMTILCPIRESYYVAKQFFVYDKHYISLIVCGLVVLGLIIKTLLIDKQRCADWKRYACQLLIGLIAFWAGAFSYIVIRYAASWVIYRGVGGRDAILIPFGLAIIIYSLLKILLPKTAYLNVVTAIIIVSGILSFNYQYIVFQKVSYWQNSLAIDMQESDDIRNNNTFIYSCFNDFDGRQADYGIRYYSVAGVSAYLAFGDNTRCYADCLDTFDYMMTNWDYIIKQTPQFRGWDSSDSDIDGVFTYDCEYSTLQVLKLKFYEIFNKEKYESEIASHGTLIYYDAGSPEAQQYLK